MFFKYKNEMNFDLKLLPLSLPISNVNRRGFIKFYKKKRLNIS